MRKTCSVGDCDRATYSRGMCRGHYQRWLDTGDVKSDVPLNARAEPQECSVDGCDLPVLARGWCKRHYYRWDNLGDLMADVPIEPRGKRASDYRKGARSRGARTAKAADDRRWRLHKATMDDTDPLGPTGRARILALVAGGRHITDACADLGVSTTALWGRAKLIPPWGRRLDTLLVAHRDPDISHGSEYAYRRHRCRCPDCRAAKNAWR